MSETFSTPYSAIIPARPYGQYATDETVQAFFTSLNVVQQGILTWFANTPLAVYTSDAIVGPLLDWTLTGIYGIPRPILTTTATTSNGPLGTNVMGTHPLGTLVVTQSGTSVSVSDDIYKRVATWILYRGDGLQFTFPWLLRRIERFLGGVNGGDVPINLATRPSETISGASFGFTVSHTNLASAPLAALLAQGYLPVPAPYSITVTVT